MAGYAAVISLKQTIERILDSSRFSLVPPSPEIIRLACRQLKPLKTTLERLDSSSISNSRKKLNALDADIKDAVWKLEDVLEALLSDQILSQFQTSAADLSLFTIDLQSLQPDVDSFIKAVKDLEVKYIYELENMGELEEDELGRSSTNDSGGIMVGFSRSFEKVKNDLTEKWDGNSVHSFLGMGGCGKTTLVKKIFEDSQVLRSFEYRVWVSVGRKSQFNEIADAILAQLDPNTYHVGAEDEVNIGMYLKKRLEGKRCLIVLDDVWDSQLLDCLTSSLPEKNSAMIQILLTTRLPTVAEHTFKPEFFRFLIRMPGLNEEESKELLRKKVFGEEDFPPPIREAAEKIARNCEGLPLMIVTVADLISKANNNDPLYWNEVAKRRSSVFMDAYNQIAENLEELGCEVTNPEVKYEFVAPPTPPSLSMFPSSLQKLGLTGLGYSWKHMKAIGSLPNLKVLTLFCNAFRGPKWGTKRKSFLSLKSLLIQDCDLEQWKPRCGSFPKLERLIIAHCYKIKEVYWPSAAPCDGRIELDGCKPILRNKKRGLKVISNFERMIKG